MTLDSYFREVLREEIRTVLREEMRVHAAPPEAGEYLTGKQAQALAQISAPTLEKWVKQGHLKKYGRGRAVRYRRHELVSVLASFPVPAAEPDVDEDVASILAQDRRGH